MQRMKNLQFRFEIIDISILFRKNQNSIIFRDVLWKGSTGVIQIQKMFPRKLKIALNGEGVTIKDRDQPI